MAAEFVVPWELPEWDRYVLDHPAGKIYHTSSWIRIVCEIGRYQPRCLVTRRGSQITGLLPLVEVRSRLTGNRMGTVPFSDSCFPIAESSDAITELLDGAQSVLREQGLAFYEMRGAPRLADGTTIEPASFAITHHFYNYVIPLSADSDAVRMTFSRKSVRQTISKGIKHGVTVRQSREARDLDAFYHLYALNRRRHGIPPQPKKLFRMILSSLDTDPDSSLYIAEHGGNAVAGLIMVRFKGTTFAKYEGVDETRRDAQPLYPLFWKTIEDACAAGDSAYDFGRTAKDNPGLCAFKSRWGTQQTELPYYYSPPKEGLSVVKSDSLKYRLFTGVFKRLPIGLSTAIGKRIFRHFG